MTTPNPLERLLHDLVIANRILAHEGVLDAYGHVSVRNPLRPDHFFLSRSRSPELVTREDIMEFDYAGNPTPGDTRPPYLERFIHGGIYEARPDIHAVVHSHADEVLPFTIANRVLQPVIHTASDIGSLVSVWDIRDKFGDTNMLVVNPEQGRDLGGADARTRLCGRCAQPVSGGQDGGLSAAERPHLEGRIAAGRSENALTRRGGRTRHHRPRRAGLAPRLGVLVPAHQHDAVLGAVAFIRAGCRPA